VSGSDRQVAGGEALDPAFIAADESLVALELEMTVFNVERDEHAARIARKEIGQRLENIPLEVLEIEELEADDEDDESEEAEGDSEAEAESDAEESAADQAAEAPADDPPDEEGDVLPEFEKLIDE